MIKQEFPVQPHALWAELRANSPVVQVESTGARPTFYITKAADAETVLMDSETFSSAIYAESTGRFMGPMLLAMDGKAHFAYRQLVAGAFRPTQLAQRQTTLIQPTIDRLLAAIKPKGRAELVAEVISQFPAQIICGIFGLPPEDGPKLLAWALDIHRGVHAPDIAMAASKALGEYLEPTVEARRINRSDDLISDIVHAQVDGQRLSDDEVYGFLRLALPAGSESTHRTLGTSIFALLTVPGLLKRVRDDRTLIAAMIEETLRWDVANTAVNRVATRDITLNGCAIPKGAAVLVLTGSANRDETRFVDADKFDLDRKPAKALSFGTGRHHCLGQHLAKLELNLALNAVLDKLPNLRLDPDKPVPVIEGFSFRGPAALHVLFDGA